MITTFKSLSIFFRPPESLYNLPDQPNQLLSPRACVVLPSLTEFQFKVMSKYIEDFVSRIDVPLLDKVHINFFDLFFDRPIFDIPRLHDFLACVENFKAYRRGAVEFWGYTIEFKLELGFLTFRIPCEELDQQVTSMAQLCGSSLPLPSALKRLDIRKGVPLVMGWQDRLGETKWLDLLHPFTGLKDLHLGKRVTIHYALTLQELAGERVIEVLPALQNIFV